MQNAELTWNFGNKWPKLVRITKNLPEMVKIFQNNFKTGSQMTLTVSKNTQYVSRITWNDQKC